MAEVVVLASGSGSNFEAIVRRIRETEHRVAALICDNPGAGCLTRADRLGVLTHTVVYRDRRHDAEQELLSLLTSLSPDLVALAGFMRVLPRPIVDAFEGRLINIHPSLLPAYPGLNAIERSFHGGSSTLGITIHYVDAGVDTGPIIQQHSIERDGIPDIETAERRIHELEHEFYPEVVVRLLETTVRHTSREQIG